MGMKMLAMDQCKHYSEMIKETVQDESPIIWVGKPAFWPFILMGSWYMVPFSLVVGGFLIFLQLLVIKSHSLANTLTLLPFTLIGVYIIVGRFVTGICHWGETLYIVTDSSIIIRAGTFTPKTLRWKFSEISDIRLTLKSHKLGHIDFSDKPVYTMPHPLNVFILLPTWQIKDGLVTVAPGFRYIKDPHEVFRIIKFAMKKYPSNVGSD